MTEHEAREAQLQKEVKFSTQMLRERFPSCAEQVIEVYDGRRAYWRLSAPETTRTWQESAAYCEAIEWGLEYDETSVGGGVGSVERTVYGEGG